MYSTIFTRERRPPKYLYGSPIPAKNMENNEVPQLF